MKTKGPVEELRDIGNEFLEGPRQLKALGWNVLFPVISLVAFIIFVICILSKS